MGTTLDPPPGVLGTADGAFFPKSLLKPLFTGEKKEKKKQTGMMHEEQRRQKYRYRHRHHSSEANSEKKKPSNTFG